MWHTRIGHERVFLPSFVCVPKALYELLILILQLFLVRLSHFGYAALEVLGATGRFA